MSTAAPPSPPVLRPALVALPLTAIVCFVAGALTSWAQTFLPDALNSFANSASGWTLVAAVVVWALRYREVPSAVGGALGFVALTLGYTVMSGLRGFTYDPTLFAVVGIVVGPFVGLAAAWLRRDGWRAALGVGLLAGIGIGEGIYGLTVVADTTSPVYWVLIGVVGLALLVVVAATRLRRPAPIALGVLVTVAVAAAFLVAYSTLGI